GKLVNRFIAFEMISLAAILLLLPLCIYYFDLRGGNFWIWDATVLFVIAVCLIYPFWGVYKIQGLMKFNLTKNVGNNVLCINRYNIRLKREIKVLAYFVGPTFVILAVLSYAAMNATFSLWIFLFCLLIMGGLFCYWSYKIYGKGLNSILRSLDEISELREE
ncbi:MAG: hypothetical protein FWE30_07860, partial [Bacteroidales bacterium]|nr:hypothetical protein [Bacteroidales bacterium]